MPTLDDSIGAHLQAALKSGELQSIEGFGKPMVDDPDWDATPAEFRMPFKILKNSGFVPAEVEMFQQRAALSAQMKQTVDESTRDALAKKISALEQSIALRLEAIRSSRGS